MVIKGGARRGATDLATHLARTDTNERMAVLELRGVASQNLPAALREMHAHAIGTRCLRPLYHASINPAADERLTPEQWARSVDQLERKLGLQDQPRAVVVHEKEGREHIHIVWGRIDDTGRTIRDSHNYRKHEEAARELEREFSLRPVQGAHIARDGQPRPERTPYPQEMQQASRTGITVEQVEADLRGAWQETRTGHEFSAAVEAKGYVLAQGDRGLVAVDVAGGVHSVARRIKGAKAADIRKRMADVDLARLPSVEQARAMPREARQRPQERPEPTRAPEIAPERVPSSQVSEISRRMAELAAEIPYMAPVAAEMARVVAGQPSDGSPLAERLDRLAAAARDEQTLPQERADDLSKTFTAAAEPTYSPLPASSLVTAWQGMLAAQGHSAEPLTAPRFWELASEHLKQEAARQEQAKQAPVQEIAAATPPRNEDAVLRDLFNAAAGDHPAIGSAVERIERQRSQERRGDSQARGLLWLDQAVRGFERVGTKTADLFGRIAGKLADMVCDLFAPDPKARLLSPEERAERQALEDKIEAAQELRDYRDREQRQRFSSVIASLDHDRQQREQEQTLERQRTRSPGPS